MSTPPSFKTDIQPFFDQYLGQMRWRFDLTDYDQVKANAAMIYGRMNSKDATMPPPPFPPFPEDFIAGFKSWMDNGFPE